MINFLKRRRRERTRKDHGLVSQNAISSSATLISYNFSLRIKWKLRKKKGNKKIKENWLSLKKIPSEIPFCPLIAAKTEK